MEGLEKLIESTCNADISHKLEGRMLRKASLSELIQAYQELEEEKGA